ncbi:putative coil containing protein [Vibrio phage 120E34-1]|nr:putative coil containing protein [Vibrio phage 120E34-1]
MTITRDVLVDIMRTPDLKDKHAGFVGFEDIHNWTWCYDKSRLGGCNNVYSMQEVQRLYALGIPTETPEEKEVLDGIESAGEVEWKNGDLLEFMGEPCVFVSMLNGFPVVKYTEDADRSLAGCFDEIIAVDRLKKPETPQHRKDRERLENGKSLHNAASKTEEAISHGIFRLWEMEDEEVRRHYCQLAEIIGYKKDKNHGTN